MKPPPSFDIQIRGLCRRFGRRWALSHVDLDLPAGSGTRVVGPNGSGKSTLLGCLATALKPHAGSITFGGEPLWQHRDALRPYVGYLAHQHHLWADLSAQENLVLWARLGGYTADTDALLERVGLASRRRGPVREYSAGMRRRLALARILIKQPKLLLLDEPFAALDPEGRALVLEVVGEMREKGSTVVIATHLPDVAAPVADRVVVMDRGYRVPAPPHVEGTP